MLILAGLAGASFCYSRCFKETARPSACLSGVGHLSDYNANLKGTAADSSIFFFDSGAGGDTVFIAGGTHPNESASILSAILIVENIRIQRGRVIVLPVANASALSNTLPGFAYPKKYGIATRCGVRFFKVGSRVSNPLDQWPDPPLFVQYDSGQRLSQEDSRNLNRNYPGRPEGTLTEEVGDAVMNLLEKENVKYAFDLHEASITYPANDVYVVSENSADSAMLASMILAERGIPIHVEISSPNLCGYSHREWSRNVGLQVYLIEAPTPFIERMPGVVDENLLVRGQDEFLAKVAEKGFAAVPFNREGYPIEWRCGLHLSAVAEALRSDNADCELVWPEFEELAENGIGYYLSGAGPEMPLY